MNAAAVLRVIVEAPIGPASANLAKFDADMKASAAQAEASMGKVAGSTEKASAATAAAGKRMETTGRSITKAGKSLALAAAPLALIGAASVKMSMDFKRSMGLVATDAGGSAREVKKLEGQVLNLARKSQFGPQQLADSLFHVESSGYRGAKAMKALSTAQQLATTGNSDLQATTYALVGATKALYGEGLGPLTRTAAEFNGIVGHGDMRMEELASALSTGVLPTAKSLGLNLRDVGAALDIMTARNVPAQKATYALNFALGQLIPHTEKAMGVFEQMGLSKFQLINKAQNGPLGLVSALELLEEHLSKLGDSTHQMPAIMEMFGGGRMSKGVVTLLQNLPELRKIYGELGNEVQKYAKHVREAENQPLVKMKKAWSSIQASLVEIGGDLLPIVVPAFAELVGLATGAAHAFTTMPHGLQVAAIDAGLFTIGLSGTLIVAGKLVEAVGGIRTAMEGVAAANLVTSLTGGLGDLRAALSLALGGEMGGLAMIGSEWAGALLGGLAKAIPAAAAGIGIANIVVSATHGDWRDAGFEAGGALAGGIAGFIVGGPLGAMLGVGIGSVAGEFGSDLAGAIFGSTDKLANFQAGLAADMSKLTDASKTQKGAFEALANAGHKVVGSHHRVQAAEKNLKQAKEGLQGTEERFKGVRHLSIGQAEQLARKENRVREAARGVVVAKRAEETAEKLHGVRLKITKRELEQTIEAEKGVAERRGKQIGPLKHLLTYEENQGASRKRVIEIGKTLIQDMNAQREAQGKVNEAENEAATKISPKFAAHLRSLKSWHKAVTEAVEKETGAFRASHSIVAATDKLFGQSAPQAIGKTRQSYEHLQGVMGPFRATTQKKLGLASGDVKSWSTSTQGGISGVESDFNSFAGKLGISTVHFHASTGAKGHQQGGFIVPGTGTGDSHHTAVPQGSFVLNRNATQAFGFQSGGQVPVGLEPRERVFMPHEVAQIGLHNLAAMNAVVPRQKGGGLGPEPQLSGPAGALHLLGQGAIHDVFKGAQRYIAKHRPKGGIGAAGNVPTGPITQMARQMVESIWGKSQWAPFVSLENQEAGWNPRALNPSSGAAGLAQALPASKYPAGAWPYRGLESAKLQLGWMMGYIKERYGSPAGAWAHEQSAGWYQQGGLVQALAKGGSPKSKKPTPSDAVQWAMHHLGSGDQWGYPGEWCGAFLAADMQAQGLPVPSGYASAASWANYGSQLGRSNVQAGAILDYGSAHVALAVSSSKQIQGNDMNGQVGTSGIGGIIGGSPLTAVRWPPYASGPGAGASPTEKVPAVFHGARTSKLSFGSLPKSLQGTEREIKRREHELPIYRHAAAAASGAPATQHAIQANVTGLESRLNQLRKSRSKLRRKAAEKKVSRHLAKALGKLTGYEQLIEGKQRAYEIDNQTAEQIVDLEPQQPELPSTASEAEREAGERAYVANFSSYVNNKERPAFGAVLGREADWRNTILTAQGAAVGMEHGWEAQIRKIEAEIERINNLDKSHPAKWWHEHPKALQNLKEERAKLPMLRFKDRELRKTLGEGRGEFYPALKNPVNPPVPPLPGTGTFEQDLIQVQGIHWPDQHGMLASLPGTRTAGMFGGAIWDTQTSIEELGLKIAQAQSAAGGGNNGPSEGKTEREQLLEELLRQANQRELLRGIEQKTFGERDLIPHAGAYASGGIVSALVGETGPEIAAFPTGTRIHSARETSTMLNPHVAVHIYEGEGRAEVEIDGKKIEAIVNRMDRRSSRGASRGLAPAGRFG